MGLDETSETTIMRVQVDQPGEACMVDQERWAEIRRLFDEERVSISEIGRRLDLDRKTVRRSLRQPTWRPYQRAVVAETLLTAHADFVQTRAPQVGYSARILYQELRASRGYTGSYETVKRCVAPLREVQGTQTGPCSGLRPHRGSKVRLIGAKPWCPFAPARRSSTCSCSRWASVAAGSITPVRMSGSPSFSNPMNGPSPISAATPGSISMIAHAPCVTRMTRGGGSGIPPSKRLPTIGALSRGSVDRTGRRPRAKSNQV